MSDLRETIALELARAWLGPKTAEGNRPDHIWLCVDRERFTGLADRILAIPKIAETLARPVSHYPDGIPRGDPGGCEGHPKRC